MPRAETPIGKEAFDAVIARVRADANRRHIEEVERARRQGAEADAVAGLVSVLSFVSSLRVHGEGKIEVRATVAGLDPGTTTVVAMVLARAATSWGGHGREDILTVDISSPYDGELVYEIDDEVVSVDEVYGAVASVVDHYCILPPV